MVEERRVDKATLPPAAAGTLVPPARTTAWMHRTSADLCTKRTNIYTYRHTSFPPYLIRFPHILQNFPIFTIFTSLYQTTFFPTLHVDPVFYHISPYCCICPIILLHLPYIPIFKCSPTKEHFPRILPHRPRAAPHSLAFLSRSCSQWCLGAQHTAYSIQHRYSLQRCLGAQHSTQHTLRYSAQLSGE